jgi:hypothetical protein
MGGVQDSPDPNAVPDAKTATEKKPVRYEFSPSLSLSLSADNA